MANNVPIFILPEEETALLQSRIGGAEDAGRLTMDHLRAEAGNRNAAGRGRLVHHEVEEEFPDHADALMMNAVAVSDDYEEFSRKPKAEIMKEVHTFVSGHSLESSKDLTKTLISKVDSADFSVNPKIVEMTQANNKVFNYESFGRQVLDIILSFIRDCGKVLAMIVYGNIPLLEELSKVQRENNTKVKELEALKTANRVAPERIPQSVHDTKLRVRLTVLEIGLKYCHYRFMYANNLPDTGNAEHDNLLHQQYEGSITKYWTVDNMIHAEVAPQVFDHYEKFVNMAGPFFQANKEKVVPMNRLAAQVANPFVGPAPAQGEITYGEMLERELEELRHKVTFHSNMEGVKANTNYERAKLEYEQSVSAAAECKAMTERLSTLANFLSGYQTVISKIVHKLKATLRASPELCTKLQGTVMLKNNDVITNPYDNNSLPGLLEFLHLEFARANLVVLKHRLIDVLNFKLRRDQMEDPIAGADIIMRKINDWRSMKLFQYFSEDIFWTVAYLLQYSPDSDVYKKALDHSMAFIHKMSEETITDTFSNDGSRRSLGEKRLLFPQMPIFSNLYEWLTNVYKPSVDYNKKQADHGTGKLGGINNNISQQKGNGISGQTSNNKFQKSSTAFVAKETTAMRMKPISSEPYDREVHRNEMLYILDPNGNRMLYTATLIPCSACTTENKKHPRPVCFPGECHKCKYYGHKERYCNNLPRKD